MEDETLYDIAIIGGGLAGLSLSIQGADKGYKVILFEKEIYPFHKVCGEYISNESWSFIEHLGVSLQELNLPKINNLNITDAKGKDYHFKLPLGGFGISRFLLDNTLYKIALGKGVKIYTDTKVEKVVFENDSFNISSGEKNYSAKVVAGTYGKRSNLDIKMNRRFTKEKKNKLNNYIGIKYHINYRQPINTIALHNFKNGYCGISRIEDAKCCLCYLTTADNLKQNNNSIALMEENLLSGNPALKKIFKEAEFLYKEPLVISQISFNNKTQVQDHIIMIGDSAGMITPLCGNGMSMALHGSKLAFNAIDRFLKKEVERKEMESDYIRMWKQMFEKRLLIGRIVQRLFGGKRAISIFLKVMHAFPSLAKALIRATHGNPF